LAQEEEPRFSYKRRERESREIVEGKRERERMMMVSV
jgi:hypothetical protein